VDERDQDSVRAHENLLAASGHPIRRDAWILDFGCGDGGVVCAFCEAGFPKTYGCDFREALGEDERLREIEQPYRIPFEDDAFDCVVSNQVFEHVQNYHQALAEIRRVLVPGGVSLHMFPSPYSLREPHVYVPLATVLQSRFWLLLWAKLGVRNEFQEDMSARAVAQVNFTYLRDHTNYLPRRETLRQARRVFPQARLLEMERAATRPSKRAAIARKFPPLVTVWSETQGRALLLPG
jgi:ubiquinone/menaquinone biosynthesis C-methylase UbiE